MTQATPVRLTERFGEALVYAFSLHSGQTRKTSPVPYISHLLAVTALVLEDGGEEDEAIAALLHDAVEDQGGWKILEDIRSRFGEKVALIVEGCTDAYDLPKPPWRERKERFIKRLITSPPEIFRVSLADKLHNARATLEDLRRYGPKTWEKFKGGKDGTLWYYHTLLGVYQANYAGYMVEELERVIDEIQQLAHE